MLAGTLVPMMSERRAAPAVVQQPELAHAQEVG
jgi:hypothetical protein